MSSCSLHSAHFPSYKLIKLNEIVFYWNFHQISITPFGGPTLPVEFHMWKKTARYPFWLQIRTLLLLKAVPCFLPIIALVILEITSSRSCSSNSKTPTEISLFASIPIEWTQADRCSSSNNNSLKVISQSGGSAESIAHQLANTGVLVAWLSSQMEMWRL